jgi:hypothetical protein
MLELGNTGMLELGNAGIEEYWDAGIVPLAWQVLGNKGCGNQH